MCVKAYITFISFSLFLFSYIRKNRKPRHRKSSDRREDLHLVYKDILKTVADTIYIYDIRRKNFVFVNDFCRKSLGYEPSEIEQFGEEFFYNIMDPQNYHLMEGHFEEVNKLKDGEVLSTYCKLRHANGQFRWFILKETVFSRTPEGQVKEVTGCITDISDKKETEKELKRSLSFIDKIMNSSPFDVFVYDILEHRNLFVNNNVLKTLGYSPSQVLQYGADFLPKVVHPEDYSFFQEFNARLNFLKNDEIRSIDFRVVAADGTIKWLSCQISVFERNLNGDVKSIMGIAKDITEKKEAEDQLRENNHFINKITETLPNNIFVEDLYNNEIIYANRDILESLGYGEKFENPMHAFVEKIHPEDLVVVENIRKDINNIGNEKKSYEFRLLHSDGTWHWIHSVYSAFRKDEKGKVLQVIASNLDITERKEMELNLKESQHFVQSILNTSPNAIYVYDLERNRNVFSARSLGEDLGYPDGYIQELGDRFMATLLHPDDFEESAEHWQKLKHLKEREILSVEGRLKHADGTWHWYHLRHAAFRRKSNGDVTQVIGVATDITTRKIAEIQLEENRAFVSRIMDVNPNVILIHETHNQKPVYINNYIEEILGYTPEEILQMGANAFEMLIHPDDQPRVLEHLEKLHFGKTGVSSAIEYRVRDKEGNWHWGLSRDAVFERDAEGNITKVIAAATEITDRKRAEEEIKKLNASLEEKVAIRTEELQRNQEILKLKETQLRIITNAVPALISYIDKDLKYVFGNDYYYKTFQIEVPIDGKHMKVVLGEENYKKVLPMVNQAMKGENVIFEANYLNKEKEHTYFKINYIPDLDINGEVRGFIVMGTDLTDRFNYERSLEERNKELSKINAELDNFIYTASHDLKSPIVNMEGLLKSLLEEASRSCAGDINVMLGFVSVSVEKLKNTIEELSEISKIQKSTESNIEEVSIMDLINDFKIEYSEQIKEAKVEFKINLEIKEILFSKKNLRSIIYNLLSNAVKFRHPDKQAIIIIDTKRSDNFVLLTLSDNGLGFDMSKKDKVFGMFKRLHSHVEGTGVGMYIVKRIMENASGKIEVESKENIGTTFKLYFPVE